MRQAEKKWKKTGLEVHSQIFCLQKSTFQKAIKDAKRVYLQDKVNSRVDQPKQLWKVLNVSLGRDGRLNRTHSERRMKVWQLWLACHCIFPWLPLLYALRQ